MERRRESSHKNSDGEQNTALIDRLSGLPDGIICHILSFLPTKFSVATSILARRWRFLWAHVPSLDFDTDNYRSAASLSSIINRVMLFRKVRSTKVFRLCCSDYECTDFELETWITIAIEGNVQNLELGLDLMTTLPRCLFTCKTLVDLELYHCIGIPSNGAVSLPSLKKLHLYSIQYKVDEALPHLLSGCPALEELIFDGLVDKSLGCFNISSPTIKRLSIYFECNFSEDYIHYNRVEINAPALKYINLVDIVWTPVSTQMLTSLIEAEVYLDYDKDDREDNSHFLSVLKFIDSLCNVKCLKLSSNMKLERAGDFADQSVSIRRFNNLTKLEWAADWLFLMKFLKSADHLEVLIINELHSCYDRVDENHIHWMKPIEVPTCLLSHLRMVRINQFGCTRQEFEMVRYVLRNARVLKRMEIYSPNHMFDFKAKFDALHIVSLFKRGSEDCEVAFY